MLSYNYRRKMECSLFEQFSIGRNTVKSKSNFGEISNTRNKSKNYLIEIVVVQFS